MTTKHIDKLSSLGFTELTNILPAEELATVSRHCTRKIWSSEAHHVNTDKSDPENNTRDLYGDPITENLLEILRPELESTCNRLLIPTYSYYRFYPKGSGLGKHKDREACEYTLTMCLNADYSNMKNSEPDYAWPLYLDGTACLTRPGDGVMYRGHDITHWRTPLRGKFQLQLFLHYVDANGPFAAEHAFDKRSSLGEPPLKDIN